MAELSDEKRRLLRQRLAARPGPARAEPSIAPHGCEIAPLSAGQAALLHEYRNRADEPVYNIVHAYRIGGQFDPGRFERALRSAIERHETLRTSFGEPRRALSVDEALRFDLLEPFDIDADGFERFAEHESARRFDLEHGPLVRATVARIGDQHGLVLGVHHLVSDAASLAVLWDDIDHAYTGDPRPVPTVGYGDHAVWHAERITGADRVFWADHLGDDPHPVDLPLAAPRPPAPDGYLTRPVAVAADALRAGGRRPLPFFASVFAALLQRYTDTDDVAVGVTASTRDHAATRSLVGYFLNVLPLRIAVDPHGTVDATIAATDGVIAGALAHRHVPYSDIVAALRRRGSAVADLARVMFVLDERHDPGLDGCEVTGRIVHPGPSVADLTVFVRPCEGVYEMSVEWSGRRFAGSDVEALADEFAAMAAWALDHGGDAWTAMPPDDDLAGPPLTTPLATMPAAFARRVASAPDRPAVRCGDEHLTAAELSARAGRIGAALARLGIAAGDRVGVMLPRSADLLASLLAIQQQRAAYVPLDPAYPAARLSHLTELAAPAITIVDANSAARPLPGTTTVEIDDLLRRTDSAGAAPEPVGSPTADSLDDPAYVIFTSGSTGRPRGVAIDQRRLAASTAARVEHYRDRPDRFLVVSSVGFDSSVAGLWWTLTAGGEVVLPTDAEVHDVDALGALIETAGVTHTLMVPSLYRALLARTPDSLASLRCVIVAGEPCPAPLVEAHHRLLPATALWNEYGPTEATVWSSVHRCEPGDDPVPIGLPIPGATARVADRWSRPRPSGAAGELLIGGAGVADGYLTAPAAAERPDAAESGFEIDHRTGARRYRSGDLVRRDDAGRLCFIGRRDRQLSISGTRLEPGEIESHLRASPGVGEAIVRVERQLDTDPLTALAALPTERASELLAAAATSPDPATALAGALATHAGGLDLLVAYVERADHDAGGATAPVAVDAILERLRAVLPSTAVPGVIEVVDRLPRTEHGKLDRAALPPALRPTARRTHRSNGHLDSTGRSDLLDVLVEAWGDVLSTGELGPDSDFFAAGGDSLQAVHLVTAVEHRTGRPVPISALMHGRTPRRLAALLATSEHADMADTAGAARPTRRDHVVALRPGGDATPLIVLPPGGGHLLVFDPLVQAIDPSIPVYGFDLPGSDRDDELPTSIEHLCDIYLPQLRALQPEGPYRFLGWSFGGIVALELARRLRDAGDEVELIGMIDTLVPGLQRAHRSRAYLELARAGDVRAIGAKLVQMVRNRWALRTTARLAQRGDDQPLDPEQRRMWVTMQVDEFVERHRPHRYDGRVVFFAAQDTYRWRTTEPWSELLIDFEIVEMDGTHEGDDGLLGGRHAEQIAAVMSERLA